MSLSSLSSPGSTSRMSRAARVAVSPELPRGAAPPPMVRSALCAVRKMRSPMPLPKRASSVGPRRNSRSPVSSSRPSRLVSTPTRSRRTLADLSETALRMSVEPCRIGTPTMASRSASPSPSRLQQHSLLVSTVVVQKVVTEVVDDVVNLRMMPRTKAYARSTSPKPSRRCDTSPLPRVRRQISRTTSVLTPVLCQQAIAAKTRVDVRPVLRAWQWHRKEAAVKSVKEFKTVSVGPDAEDVETVAQNFPEDDELSTTTASMIDNESNSPCVSTHPSMSSSFEAPTSPISSSRAVLERMISSIPLPAESRQDANFGYDASLRFAGVGGELHRALCDAHSIGLTSNEEIVAVAEQLVLDWKLAREAARDLLARLTLDFKSQCLRTADLETLKDSKARLNGALFAARDLNLAESEIKEAELCRRRAHNRIEDVKGQVRVFCRLRPRSEAEESMNDPVVVRAVDDMTVSVDQQGNYGFDCVFEPGTQADVFEDCHDLVQSAFDGVNVTIFMYGQTGAGKTHTMYGQRDDEGIAGRAISEVFALAEHSASWQKTFVSASVVELYNNSFTDLAARSSGSRERMSVRSDGDVVGLSEISVSSEDDLRSLLVSTMDRRAVSSHVLNSQSSRSHYIFTIHITTTNCETSESTTGKLVLCDLAGSERLKKTDAVGDRKKEAIEINKSLTALGDVIQAVARKQKQIPYRNHKLGQILQDSIGGAAKTLMIVTCSPTLSNLSETVATLNFATRAKKITNSRAPSKRRSQYRSRHS